MSALSAIPAFSALLLSAGAKDGLIVLQYPLHARSLNDIVERAAFGQPEINDANEAPVVLIDRCGQSLGVDKAIEQFAGLGQVEQCVPARTFDRCRVEWKALAQVEQCRRNTQGTRAGKYLILLGVGLGAKPDVLTTFCL